MLNALTISRNTTCGDERETLCNVPRTGSASQIQYSAQEIDSIRGVMVDLDPAYLGQRHPGATAREDLNQLWTNHIRPGLAALGLADHCEARISGTGLHLLFWLDLPVQIEQPRDITLWDARIRVLQTMLLGDPQAPSITALTRPVGSINSKRGILVTQLQTGTPITADALSDIIDGFRERPAAALLLYAFGTENVEPCPFCAGAETTCRGLSNGTNSYGCCGQRRLKDVWKLLMQGETGNGKSIPEQQNQKFLRAVREVDDSRFAPRQAAHRITGITPDGLCTRDRDAVLGEITHILCATGKFYRLGDDIVVESESDGDQSLEIISRSNQPQKLAYIHCSNAITCVTGDSESRREFALPRSLIDPVLVLPEFRSKFAEIKHYSRRPIYTRDFHYVTTGYSAEYKSLVHGNWDDLPTSALHNVTEPSLAILAPVTCELLSGFCFAGHCDLVATISMLLTGLLSNHFIESPKPLFVINGNQPSVGKSKLGELIGTLLDGNDTTTIHYTNNDEELAKTIGALLDGDHQSLFVIDNCRTSDGRPIESAVLESLSVSSVVSVRRLKSSELIRRPNSYIWALTVNNAVLGRDLSHRAMIIRLYYEGDPTQREHTHSQIIDYAKQRRTEILGEMYGLIRRWIEQQCPKGSGRHRCAAWAEMLGGILEVAGERSFIDVQQTLVKDVDESHMRGQTLAEAVLVAELQSRTGFILFPDAPPTQQQCGKPASEWQSITVFSGILPAERSESPEISRRRRNIQTGQYLGTLVGRTFEAEAGCHRWRLTLRRSIRRSNQSYYFFVAEPIEPESVTPFNGEGSEAVEVRQQP